MKTYSGPFVADLLNGMTSAVWSHEFVVDGTAFYVRGSPSRMEAFLLVISIPATETWVNAFITRFPSKRDLSAEDLHGAVRTMVEANVVRRRLGPVAASRTRFSTAPSPKAPPAAIILCHEGIGSQALFRKMRRAT